MKFGYFTLTDNPVEYGSERKDSNQMVLDLVEQCVYAEDLGFNSVWVPEHHFAALGVLPSPSMLLSHIAAKTSRVQLAPATVLLPASHPIRMAEEYALLDVLSHGRAIFSAGRGYDKREYDVFGINFNDSREIFFEQLDIIQMAWTQDTFAFEGKHFTIPEIRITPRPVQKPHLPIYVAVFSEPSIEKAAEMGENVIFAPFAATMVFGSIQNAVHAFQTSSARHGFSGKSVRCSYFINVTENVQQAEQTKQRMLKYFHGLVPALPSDPSKAPPHIRYFVDIVDRLNRLKTTDLSEQTIIVGDAEHCTQVLKNVEQAGIDEVILYFDFGGLSHKETLKSMERFAAHVLPHFSEQSARV